MRSLSLRTLCISTWNMYKAHWKVLLIASVIPFIISVLREFVFQSNNVIGSVVALLALVVTFLSYIYQTMYILEVHNGHTPDWKQLFNKMTLGYVWRIIRANMWMIFVIVWPMFVLVAAAGTIGYFISQNSFTGTTLSLIAMGVAAVIGAIVSFIRSLSYTMMLYLAFTTNKRVRTLQVTSREYMRTNRIKFLKIVLLQIVVGVAAAFTVVLLPVVQSLVYIMMVLFSAGIVGHISHKTAQGSSNEDITIVPIEE